MKNMFFYTRKEPLPPKEGDTELHYREYVSSFNINKVVQAIIMEDGSTSLILDDYHERIEELPVRNKKGVVTSYRNRHYTHQSSIHLEPEDTKRFHTLTSIG